MIRKPSITDYPEWLREYIERPMARSVRSEEENVMSELMQVFQRKRADPVCKVLFGITVEHIRRDFDMWTLRQQIYELRVQNSKLLAKKFPFSPEEIAALKECASSAARAGKNPDVLYNLLTEDQKCLLNNITTELCGCPVADVKAVFDYITATMDAEGGNNFL